MRHNHLSTSSKLHSQEEPQKTPKDWDLKRNNFIDKKISSIASQVHDTDIYRKNTFPTKCRHAHAFLLIFKNYLSNNEYTPSKKTCIKNQ